MLSIVRRISVTSGSFYKNNVLRNLSTSQNKLTEENVEEVKIPVPWGHIAGKWWGDKNVPPVLAIHGWQDNANTFDKLIPLLNLPSVLAVDLPGHGLSSHFPVGKAYDFEEYLIMLRRIVKHNKWTNISLLTHSLGGALGYTYSSIFPNEVKWLINFDCARALLTLLRHDIPSFISTGVDSYLKIEKQKKEQPPPVYKMSDLVQTYVKGSLGSIASPEAALILIKRGLHEVEKLPVEKSQKDSFGSDLKEFIEHEQLAIMSLPENERESIIKHNMKLIESSKKTMQEIEKFQIKNDNKYYILGRDPLIKVGIFDSLDKEFILESAKKIKCPVLSLRAKNGFLYGSTRKLYEDTLNILKTSCDYFEHHDVEGTHHAHLNNPESLAPVINEFIKKVHNLKSG